MEIIDYSHMLCQIQCCNYCCNDNNSFFKIEEKTRVKKKDHIKVVVVERDVIQKEEFVQISGDGNFVVAIVIVAFQK
jgi:3D (Asp-Asp-Asp) domain-containing protein